MLLWHAHMTLAAQLGDPVPAISALSIPDGVRYSRAQRDSYIYRAMMEHMAKTIEPLSQHPREVKVIVLQSIFPNFMRKVTQAYSATYTFPATTGGLSSVPLYVYNLRLNFGDLIQPVPIVTSWHAQRIANRKIALNHYHDTIADITVMPTTPPTTRLKIYPSINDTTIDVADIEMDYLPVPTHPNTQLPTANLDFEEIYLDKILRRAAAYAALDSQDIVDVATSLQMLLQ